MPSPSGRGLGEGAGSRQHASVSRPLTIHTAPHNGNLPSHPLYASVRPMTPTLIETTILALTAERGPDKSICPSEVARALQPENWQPLMTPVRQAAIRLVAAGQIEILRKGRPVSPEAVRGVIRLRAKNPPDAPDPAPDSTPDSAE